MANSSFWSARRDRASQPCCLIAGLEEVSEGSISIGDDDVTDASPSNRGIAPARAIRTARQRKERPFLLLSARKRTSRFRPSPVAAALRLFRSLRTAYDFTETGHSSASLSIAKLRANHALPFSLKTNALPERTCPTRLPPFETRGKPSARCLVAHSAMPAALTKV